MLNRRQLRIKALQAIYAHVQSDNESIEKTQTQLLSNLDRLYDLYIYQLSFITAIQRFAEDSSEVSKQKYFPTEEDLNPNQRFINNRFIAQLDRNRQFRKKEESLKISWGAANEIIRKTMTQFRQSEEYIAYMNKPQNGFEQDKEIMLTFVENHMIFNDLLRSYFEEINSMWSEDYYMALALVNNTIYSFKESDADTKPMPTLYKPGPKGTESEDKIFLLDYVKQTIQRSPFYDSIIEKKAANWEFERLALMDLLLLRMGMAEIFDFPTIPLKVTLNEIIELAKHFSSPRSSVFINGILDRTISEGLKDKTIVKTGRGLIGN